MAPMIEQIRPLGWKKPSSLSQPKSRYAPKPADERPDDAEQDRLPPGHGVAALDQQPGEIARDDTDEDQIDHGPEVEHRPSPAALCGGSRALSQGHLVRFRQVRQCCSGSGAARPPERPVVHSRISLCTAWVFGSDCRWTWVVSRTCVRLSSRPRDPVAALRAGGRRGRLDGRRRPARHRGAGPGRGARLGDRPADRGPPGVSAGGGGLGCVGVGRVEVDAVGVGAPGGRRDRLGACGGHLGAAPGGRAPAHRRRAARRGPQLGQGEAAGAVGADQQRPPGRPAGPGVR